MTYILVFMIFLSKGGSGDYTATSITAEYNTRNACEMQAADLYKQAGWADKIIWSCKPKGEK